MERTFELMILLLLSVSCRLLRTSLQRLWSLYHAHCSTP
ncbi:hypothetical protein SLEP1_g7236 [Rubroshorea leprosula]|uniref:Uncharacterized protein n=1 Tax=Rubroshorea leprosula TaxID=152421 RepID=A0AAV5I3J3_9ROSI|nr:hypothetical protein SLEP1_g7236 [Rubroshorea leprosula]